jgi:hypothetical protein
MIPAGVNILNMGMPQQGQAQPVYYDENNVWQWSPYATGGATRPDSFTGMTPEFNSALEQFYASMPEDIRSSTNVYSGYRSPERQAELWQAALERYGSPEAARRWVAPPGRSQHNHGNAADLRYLSPEAREWAHANAANFGLAFPLGHEDWHIELASARGGQPTGGMSPGQPSGVSTSAPSGMTEAQAMAAGMSPQQAVREVAVREVDPVREAFNEMKAAFRRQRQSFPVNLLRGSR